MVSHLKYRPDIDGLRAVAVLGVVLFHAGLGVSGGYVGVDVFFVISGFLITCLILRDLERGTFSMLDFWERRVRRIFPALAVVVVTCLVGGWFLMLPFAYLVLAQSAIALSLFASNFQFWRHTDYFGPAAEENLLLHTWSLSVEEQFYLVVPMLMVGLFAWRRRVLLPWAALAGIILSFAASEWWLRLDPSGAFYLLPSRAWAMAAGALLAFARPFGRGYASGFTGAIGLLLIVVPYFLYSEKTTFPGIAAIPPVLGAALIIWSGNAQGSAFHRAMASKPLVHIGLLSYSLYLWHWPMFAMHRYLTGATPPMVAAIGYVALALGLSEISLRFVERPFRERKFAGTRKSIFGLFIGSTAIVLVTCLAVYRSGGVSLRLPESVARLDRVEGDKTFVGRNGKNFPEGGRSEEFGALASTRTIMLWGDSHASVALWALDPVCRDLNLRGVAFTRGGTAPVFQWSASREGNLEHQLALKNNERVRDFITRSAPKPEFALLVFRWSHYVPRERRLPQMIITPVMGFGDALVETAGDLISLGIKVGILLEPPVFEAHVPRTTALHEWRGLPAPFLSLAGHRRFNEDYARIVSDLREKVPSAILFDPLPAFLSPDGTMQFRDADGTLLFRDEHHLTRRGAERLVPLIKSLLIK
jgi:peptidoglycan/LPS O-acetylase OafA/YrhL